MAKGNPRKENKGKDKVQLKGGKDPKGAAPKGKTPLK
jgi:hypothetical protein